MPNRRVLWDSVRFPSLDLRRKDDSGLSSHQLTRQTIGRTIAEADESTAEENETKLKAATESCDRHLAGGEFTSTPYTIHEDVDLSRGPSLSGLHPPISTRRKETV